MLLLWRNFKLEHKKEALLSLARASIAEALRIPYPLDLEETLAKNPWLEEEGACFVTLTTSGHDLRGCIGTISAHRKLYEDIIHNAKSAAMHDPRFTSLTADEFEDIKVEVSLLTEPHVLLYNSVESLKSKIDVGVDGVILKQGMYQATFLPQVWKQLPTFELFFSHLCQKAGMEANCLDAMPEILIYQVEEYAEA